MSCPDGERMHEAKRQNRLHPRYSGDAQTAQGLGTQKENLYLTKLITISIMTNEVK